MTVVVIVGIVVFVLICAVWCSDADVPSKALGSMALMVVGFLTLPLIYSIWYFLCMCWTAMKLAPVIGFIISFVAAFWLICSVLAISGGKKSDH